MLLVVANIYLTRGVKNQHKKPNCLVLKGPGMSINRFFCTFRWFFLLKIVKKLIFFLNTLSYLFLHEKAISKVKNGLGWHFQSTTGPWMSIIGDFRGFSRFVIVQIYFYGTFHGQHWKSEMHGIQSDKKEVSDIFLGPIKGSLGPGLSIKPRFCYFWRFFSC